MRISDWSSDVCSSDLSEDDRKASIAAVADGTVDVITSSHDPRGPEDKRLPFADAAPGMAGAETLLALSLNLVREDRKSVVEGKSVSVRVDLGGRRIITQTNNQTIR